MKKFLFFLCALFLAGCAIQSAPAQPPILTSNITAMKIESPSFQNNQNLPARFTCQGEGISPALTISAVPPEAKSLALIVDDPDAPAGTWTHWTIWNIPADATEIPENVGTDFAVQGLTSLNTNGFNAPCPPSGTHHYRFKLYALSASLDLPKNSHVGDLIKSIQQNLLAQSELTGLYQKQ